jgi:hypothetical protein
VRSLLVAALTVFFAVWPVALAQDSPPAALRISRDVVTPLTLSAAEMKNMPRQTLKVVNPTKKDAHFSTDTTTYLDTVRFVE